MNCYCCLWEFTFWEPRPNLLCTAILSSIHISNTFVSTSASHCYTRLFLCLSIGWSCEWSLLLQRWFTHVLVLFVYQEGSMFDIYVGIARWKVGCFTGDLPMAVVVVITWCQVYFSGLWWVFIGKVCALAPFSTRRLRLHFHLQICQFRRLCLYLTITPQSFFAKGDESLS